MDKQRTMELLTLQSAEIPAPTPFCLEDQQVAEYFQGVLSQKERDKVERHVADCRYCAVWVGALARMDQQNEQGRVPEESLATAKLMGQPHPKTNTRLAPWAAAAVVVLALGIYFQTFTEKVPGIGVKSPAGAHAVQSGNIRETRNIDTGALGPRILLPGEGQETGTNGVFKWTAVPSSLFYLVRIVTEDGDLLWQERVEGTEWRLPAGLGLVSGTEHYIRIDAYLTEAKSLHSEYVLFRFEENG